MKNVAITTSDGKYQMSMLFESTACDIFRKFDMLLHRELGYNEFKGFCECVGRPVNEYEFNQLLSRFASTKVRHEGNHAPAQTGEGSVHS